MSKKILVTNKNNTLLIVTLEDDKVVELIFTEKNAQGPTIGDIYIGKVQSYIKSTNSAFVTIEKDTQCYLATEKPLRVGDEIIVQVQQESVKTKKATVSTNLNFTGRYSVLTSENKKLSVSSKLKKTEKERLLHLAQTSQEECGWIMRTDAANVSDEVIVKEMDQLKEEYNKLMRIAPMRTCFSCLKKSETPFVNVLQELMRDDIEEIVVEDREVFDIIKDIYPLSIIRYYEDSSYTLSKLYNIEKCLEEALNKKVWLKSGSYIIIEHTEAMTVIDVNTGKNISKKVKEDYFSKVNQEAAKEIARQIRLRNLSGIVIIDFISMKNKENIKKIAVYLNQLLQNDRIQAKLIDVTKLQLVEITRKKVRKNLYENYKEYDR